MGIKIATMAMSVLARPIETAPRDGTEVYLVSVQHGGALVSVHNGFWEGDGFTIGSPGFQQRGWGRLRDALVAEVSHRVRTPLRGAWACIVCVGWLKRRLLRFLHTKGIRKMNYSHPSMPEGWYPGQTKWEAFLDLIWWDALIANSPLLVLLLLVIIWDWWLIQ